MKVIYGNDYKDAISNPPIEINDLKVFMQYKECYPYVEVLDEDEELEEEDEYEGEDDNLDELLTTDPDSYQEPLIDNAVFYDNGDDDEDEER